MVRPNRLKLLNVRGRSDPVTRGLDPVNPTNQTSLGLQNQVRVIHHIHITALTTRQHVTTLSTIQVIIARVTS